jgi:hypothetical protein
MQLTEEEKKYQIESDNKFYQSKENYKQLEND